jgi:hypothetical protein
LYMTARGRQRIGQSLYQKTPVILGKCSFVHHGLIVYTFEFNSEY